MFFFSWRGRNKQTPQLSQLSRVIGLESFLEVVAILDTVMPNFISVFFSYPLTVSSERKREFICLEIIKILLMVKMQRTRKPF